MKRLFDTITAFIAMIILAPILVPVMIILRFSGEGEIFYFQIRIGRNSDPFFITKFATMLKDSPNIGPGEHTLKGDPRVLPFGKFLRKSKINELAQLWDIFVGKMSWVGPRPTTPNHHSLYPEYYVDVLKDHRPGLTGVGSIIFRDEESILSQAVNFEHCYAHEIVPYKAKVEKWYKAWVVIKPDSDALRKTYPGIPYEDIRSFGKSS
jgi:lipopolysaccharide/colanic/teichoic acid biosynthesis glycosyltransferase